MDNLENQEIDQMQTQENSSSTSEDKTQKTFTQAELDNIIAKRIAREKKNWETSLADEQRKQNMTEFQKLTAEKDELINKANERIKNMNEKIFLQDFKSQAKELGFINPELAYKLVDKADLMDEEGNVNAEVLKTSLETLLNENPYLKGQTQQIPNLPGSPAIKNSGTLTKEQLSKMSPEQVSKLDWSLIQQALKN